MSNFSIGRGIPEDTSWPALPAKPDSNFLIVSQCVQGPLSNGHHIWDHSSVIWANIEISGGSGSDNVRQRTYH